ncbi:UNVERIFIED_CONTAM: hypothetical protein GTU68_056506 [Idotea baltica]|nr:hypothetical protein [Idotea baltica]
MSSFSQQIQTAAQHVRSIDSRIIDTAIILGSGLSDVAPALENTLEFAYHDIPGLSVPSVISHHGRLTIGQQGQDCIAICQGRHHLYEGYTPQQVAMLVYILSQLGTKKIIITNAAGALNTSFRPGDIMLIEDHINFTGQNPIVGQGDDLGNRFTDMSQAYNTGLLNIAEQAAKDHQINYHKGVYCGVLGPSLETSAERRMLAKFGGDAVGMSTILEVIAANQCNMQVLGLSAITNMALGDEQQQVDTIEDVLRHAETAGKGMKKIIATILNN